jgi:hypothetical protein
MKGFPSNSFNVFEVVGFGAFCGATHSTLRVTNGRRLTFLFENSYKFHFLTKKYEKLKTFLVLFFLHPKNIP